MGLVSARVPHLLEVTLPANGAWTTRALLLSAGGKAYRGGKDGTAAGAAFAVPSSLDYVTFWLHYALQGGSTTGYPKIRCVFGNGVEDVPEPIIDTNIAIENGVAQQMGSMREIHLWVTSENPFVYPGWSFQVRANKTAWLQIAEVGDPNHPGRVSAGVAGWAGGGTST